MLKLDTVNAYYGDVQVLMFRWKSTKARLSRFWAQTAQERRLSSKQSAICFRFGPVRSITAINALTSFRHISSCLWEFLWSRKGDICFRTCPCTTISCWALIA